MNANKISVIIILYYSKHLLFDIISNIKNKINQLGEIILVNNSGENIDEFKSDIVRVVYPSHNLGYGSGINLGVQHSKYNFLLFLNPDLHIQKFDVSLENYQKEVILSGHNPKMPGYCLKFPNLISFLVTNTLIDLKYVKAIDKRIHFKRIKDHSEDIEVDYISGALIFTTKPIFNKIGGFDSSFFLFYEETDFCKRASQLNIPVIETSKIAFDTKNGKSSSMDVNHIKIKAGIDSSKLYHSRYSGIVATQCTLILLKAIYGIIILVMIPFSLISKRYKSKREEFIYRINYF